MFQLSHCNFYDRSLRRTNCTNKVCICGYWQRAIHYLHYVSTKCSIDLFWPFWYQFVCFIAVYLWDANGIRWSADTHPFWLHVQSIRSMLVSDHVRHVIVEFIEFIHLLFWFERRISIFPVGMLGVYGVLVSVMGFLNAYFNFFVITKVCWHFSALHHAECLRVM